MKNVTSLDASKALGKINPDNRECDFSGFFKVLRKIRPRHGEFYFPMAFKHWEKLVLNSRDLSSIGKSQS